MRKAIDRLGVFFLTCLLLLCIGAGALAEDNLLSNGGFEQMSGALPAGWIKGMWVTSAGATYIESSADAHTGERSALVENVQANDARLEQNVKVKPQTYYRLSAWVKAEECGEGRKGANVSFADVYGTSPDVHDTDGEWVLLELYARTGKGQKEVTVMARVGGYGSENTGRAWFDDVSLVEVDSVPAGAGYVDLATPEPEYEAEEASGPDGAVIALLFAVSLLYVLALALSMRSLRRRREGGQTLNALVVLLAMAALIRLVLSGLVPGYGVDMGCFSAWSLRMAELGPANFYSPDYFCDYPPGYLLVLLVNGLLMKVFHLPYSSAATEMLLKFVPVACDIAGAAVLYRLAQGIKTVVQVEGADGPTATFRVRRSVDSRAALILSGLYAFNPATVIVSACWGQVDSVLALLLLLTLFFAAERKWHASLPVYIAACLTKPQALMLAPLGVVVIVKAIAVACKEGDRRTLRSLGMGALLSLVCFAAIVLPFSLNQPADWLIQKYAETLGSYNYATLSTGNLMFLLGGNWKDAAAASPLGLSYSALGWALMAFSILLSVFLYLKDQRGDSLFEVSALLLSALYVLGPKMHERYLMPVLILLLMAYALRPDKRTLLVFGAYSAALAVNAGMVLAFEHLIAPNEWVGYLLGAVNLAALCVQVWTAWDHCVRDRAMEPAPLEDAGKDGELEEGEEPPEESPEDARMRDALLKAPDARLHMRRRDWALMLGVTLAYAAVAFVNLGSTKAPQTMWRSSAAGEQVVFDLGERREDFNVYVYVGISDPSYTISVSEDGENWSDEELMNEGECFLWIAHCKPYVNSEDETKWTGEMQTFTGRYVRLTLQAAGAVIGEVGFLNAADHAVLPVSGVSRTGGVEGRAQDAALLIDEQDTVPDLPSYLNGTYFDEIYHARTGYEHLNGLHTFEWTHPPLGKLLMALCIHLFGMTPFGWRFAGTVSGILMLPVMYLLGKQLFRRTAPAFYATALLALDCMHFTQTRIATIDTFVVLFIMAMYLCMLRWTQMSFYHQRFTRTLIPLGLSGVFMALAVSSKWTGMYAAAGLALLFFIRLYQLWRQARWARAHEREDERLKQAADAFPRYALITVALCFVFFIALPLLVYCLCYIPQLSPDGPVTLKRIWDTQVSMYSYHSKLVDDHFFKSPWWQWPLIMKPMWYYDAPFKAPGTASVIYAMGNPAVWWAGLAAVLFVLARTFLKKCISPLIGYGDDRPMDRALPFLAVGFLSQYLPWVLVPRSTFIYHYFPSVPFIILCTAQVWRTIKWKQKETGYAVIGLHLALAAALFVLFYPAISGLTVSRTWMEAAAWFKNWLWY